MASDTDGIALDDSGSDGQTPDDDDDDDDDGSSDGEPAECPSGEVNACGGCTALDGELGDACNGCDGMELECDGTDALRCVGFDSGSETYFPDADDDGFGDANADGVTTCEEPPAGHADNDEDCDDDEAAINPDAAEECNGIDDDCDTQVDEAPDNTLCDDVCCSFENVCDGTACVPKCDAGELCGADLDVCCGGGEICFAGECVVPDAPCEFDENCAIDEICAPGVGECVPEAIVPECELEPPPPGEFDPIVGCHWSAEGLELPLLTHVVATPIVINLSDDNGDGATDREDVPDIALLSYDLDESCCNTPAAIRVLSGECNEDGTMETLATISEPAITNDAGLAAGDLDGDGVPEIVAVGHDGAHPQGLIAFTRVADDASEWEVLWENPDYPAWNVHTRGGPTISLYDLEGDGTPEVIVGNVVLSGADGSLVWDGEAAAVPGGIGNNGFLGPSSAVADIDQDGEGEVIAGNSVYEADGTIKWTFTYETANSACDGNLECDGFDAVANFDDDDEGEVVIVRLGEVFVIDDDGSLMHQAQLPVIDCDHNESGPPTVADFDGDGVPEIGTASADYYVVVDFECTGPGEPVESCTDAGILWQVENNDCSSRVTASSVFDFEGDGRAEVVYADQTTMRIFDGVTGAILYEDDTHGSHTRIEMPVIADVDNDGAAEIVVGENGSGGGDPGIDIFQDSLDNWVRTRRVWNQHAYAITHIGEDGDIPAAPETNWLNERFNNFRQNVQPDGLFHAPNATSEGILCGLVNLGGGDFEVEASVLVRNEGTLPVPAGTPVEIAILDEPVDIVLTQVATTEDLLPGQVEVFNLEVVVPGNAPAPPFELQATIDPNDDLEECIESDNATTTTCAIPG